MNRKQRNSSKLGLFILLFLLTLFGFSQEKESWIDKPTSDWPQIALTNHVQYNNGDQYIDPSFTYAGTGFLIDSGKDTLAATAKHVLWIAKNARSLMVELNEHLDRWVMKTKGDRQDSVLLGSLINEDRSEVLEGPNSTNTERDWIVFSLKKGSPNVYPLKPRYSTPEPGEKT